MTVKVDLAAIVPTSTARAAFEAAGTNLDVLLTQVVEQVTDLQRLLKQVIAFHPSSGDDAANYTALGNVLAELN